ncbi:MAG: hypothetical protein U1F43_29700 [Myxococcota bacterium]
MLIGLVVVVLIVVAGIALASVAERSASRWRALVRELVPGGRSGHRDVETLVSDGHLVLTTALTPTGMPYQTAARILSRGSILAGLYQLGAEASERELRARIGLARLGAPTLRAQIAAFTALADALEALPLPEAMTRRFVDLPTDTASHERLAAFQAMLQWYPRSGEVLAACHNELAHGDDPAIKAAARQHLDATARGSLAIPRP